MKQPRIKPSRINPGTTISDLAVITPAEWAEAKAWWEAEKRPFVGKSERINTLASIELWEAWHKGGPIVPNHVQQWVAHLHGLDYAPGTVEKFVKRVRMLLRFVMRKTGRPFFELIRIRLPPKPRKSTFVLTEEQYQKLRSACIDGELKVLMSLMWNAGLSVGDASRLKPEAVDFVTRTISGERWKSKVPYVVPFDAGSEFEADLLWMKDIRDAYLAKFPNDWFYKTAFIPAWFSHYNTKENSTFNLHFKRLAKQVGVEIPAGQGSHAFRRSFCTKLANSGIHPRLAMVASGHTEQKTFNSYVKPDTEALREQMSMMNARIKFGADKRQAMVHSLCEKSNETNGFCNNNQTTNEPTPPVPAGANP